jgi:hypothetical protein
LDYRESLLNSGLGFGRLEFGLEAASGEEEEFSLSVSAMMWSWTRRKLFPF